LLRPRLIRELGFDLTLWRDSLVLALIFASLVGLAGLVIYVYVWMPSLPPLLPLHYNGLGSVDLIGPRTDLYKMPGIGAVVFLADLVLSSILYRRERMAAALLLTSSALVQVMLIVATINIVRLAFGD
jgi:hypothetical protein